MGYHIPLILTYMSEESRQKVHTQLTVNQESLELLPILHGKLNPAWKEGKRCAGVTVDVSFLQTLNKSDEFLFSVSEVQFSLRVIQTALLYYTMPSGVHEAMHLIFDQICSEHVANFLHIYKILHFLLPTKASIFLNGIFFEIKKECRTSCFQSTRKVKHNDMLRWLNKFLKDYFVLDVPYEVLNKKQINRINVWPLLVKDFPYKFRKEVFHLDTLKMASRCYSLIDEVMAVSNRNEAQILRESLRKRQQ